MKIFKKWTLLLVLIALIGQWGTMAHVHVQAHHRNDADTCHICQIQHHLDHQVSASDTKIVVQNKFSFTTLNLNIQKISLAATYNLFSSRAPPFLV